MTRHAIAPQLFDLHVTDPKFYGRILRIHFESRLSERTMLSVVFAFALCAALATGQLVGKPPNCVSYTYKEPVDPEVAKCVNME